MRIILSFNPSLELLEAGENPLYADNSGKDMLANLFKKEIRGWEKYELEIERDTPIMTPIGSKRYYGNIHFITKEYRVYDEKTLLIELGLDVQVGENFFEIKKYLDRNWKKVSIR